LEQRITHPLESRAKALAMTVHRSKKAQKQIKYEHVMMKERSKTKNHRAQMKVITQRTVFQILFALVFTGYLLSVCAQDVSIPDPGLNAAIREALQKPAGPLTEQDLLRLISLDAGSREVRSVEGLAAARNLERLFLDSNRLTNFSLPGTMTRLIELHLGENPLTNCSMPGGLANLNVLDIQFCALTQFTLPAGLTGLTDLDLGVNGLTSFAVPADATNLVFLGLLANQLTNLTLPPGLTHLSTLDLEANKLTHLALPSDLTSLQTLLLRDNQLRELILPAGLGRLSFLALDGNQLAQFIFPAGLTNLSSIGFPDNQLTTITLPPDITQLTGFFVGGNPFTTLVLSESLAATNLADDVAFLRNQGVQVFTYPLLVRLTLPREQPIGAFRFGITGPPGVYAVLSSSNLTDWNALTFASNPLGSVLFTDVEARLSPRKFYRLLRVTPANMVFIPPNTFTMGSPTNEQDRSIDEGPQTTVTLTRGFLIGKFEVTQGEYLSVMNTNPSVFPGDLSRPVSRVSWPDATNYCWRLTQLELAAGRIPTGSKYRLPTEAEWECAARAGTSTRFSYGDDPDYTRLGDYAWYASNSGLTAHPVGQKLPNPWGLYDMEGNVVEWCQDWFGSLPGGVQTDPTGPASSVSGRKVVRGGAFDNSEQSSRSASRLLFSAVPPLTDTDLGFRVALIMER
jgi:formylglycine-generating enzyme required for sulfatase activity